MVFILIGAVLIGLTLGMLGSGGSAITVPVLVYLVGHSGKVSIAESMAIVGLISFAAALPYGRSKQIDWRSVIYFGIPGMAGTYIGAWLGGIASEVLQLIVFGCVLLLAAYSMLRKRKTSTEATEEGGERYKPPIPKVAVEGTVVGIVTGFVGVGGGFLIVPALVILGRLPMRLAIGTSLVIIAAKSAVGFAKYQHYLVSQNLTVDVQTIAVFAVIGIIGSLIGRSINQRMNQQALRRVFAVFLILLGSFVIVREGSKVFTAQNETQATASATGTDAEDIESNRSER
ncbi:MAG: sulfite exporter TauE/SafE family protein [Planctomycetota bacterium]